MSSFSPQSMLHVRSDYLIPRFSSSLPRCSYGLDRADLGQRRQENEASGAASLDLVSPSSQSGPPPRASPEADRLSASFSF